MERNLDGLLTGRLVGTNVNSFAGITVWFAYLPTDSSDGEGYRVETIVDESGNFAFDIPEMPVRRASVGADIEGAAPVDMEASGEALEPGDIVIPVDNYLPAHLRYGGG